MDHLAIAIEAARLGAEAILQTKSRVSTKKQDGSDVTPADKASQTAILTYLKTHCPEDLIIGEEKDNPTVTGPRRWIVDPLDGTANYRVGNPGFAVNVAYGEENQLVCGVMHFPELNKIVIADRVSGQATINGAVCQPFAKTAPIKRRLGLDLHRNVTDEFLQGVIGPLLRAFNCYPRNEPTSMSLLDLIEGTTDIYLSNNQHIWDPAAGVVALVALGGEVFIRDGSPATWDTIKLPLMCYTRSAALKEEVLKILQRKNT